MYIDRNMKNEKFEVSSISTEKCSKLRPVLRFPVTQKAALVWNTTVFEIRIKNAAAVKKWYFWNFKRRM